MRESYELNPNPTDGITMETHGYEINQPMRDVENVANGIKWKTKQEQLREYEIKLSFLHRGCIVKIGCKSIAFETNEKAVKEISRYVNDPVHVFDEWMKLFNEE